MDRKSSNDDLHSLLDSIIASDVVEIRAQLLAKLSELNLTEKTDLASLVECLTTFWEDFTCLDVSQCILNKVVLQVAAKYVDSDLSGCFVQFIALATKASSWCGKHLKMTLMSMADSQEEEHFNIFFQLLLGFLSLSAAILTALPGYPVLANNDSAVIVERFILEQLNLMKDVVSETKKINSLGSEILKATQNLIDNVMILCKGYCVALNQDLCDLTLEKDDNGVAWKDGNFSNHVINITAIAIEKLCEIGVLAANDGGSLVAILNMSWKAVVTLLQQGKAVLKERVSAQDIILTLISIVNKHLKCAAVAWSSSLAETVSATEARRTFLPIKFYLINAVKICSLYPCQVYLIYKEVVHCVLVMSTFRILLSFEELLNNASEMFSELLERTSLDLLTSILNSANLKKEHKFDVLDCLFDNQCCSNSIHEDLSNFYSSNSLVQIFSVTCETMHRDRLFLLGRIISFHTLLRYSIDLEDVWMKIIQKLSWFLDILIVEEVYSSILDLQIPVTYVSGKTSEVVWQPIFSALLDALKTFTIMLSSSEGWAELEALLFENLFHPHFLCCEAIMDIWCFVLRHGETDLVASVINKIFSLMKLVASPESVLVPASPLRKVARTICLLLSNGSPSMADSVYSSIFGDNKCQLSSIMSLALHLEGFPLHALSDNLRSIAKETIVSDFFGFIGRSDDKLMTDSSSGVIGASVFTLSASLHSHQVSISDVEMNSLSFLITIIRNSRNVAEISTKENYHKLLNEMLGIISNLAHLYTSDAMEEVVLELQNLFVSASAASDPLLCQCKPYLALFMGGIGDMEMSETDDCAKSCAVWELYHMLFREQHWAVAHLALAAFGYFAARTSCNKLWRFVPPDAALSYDLNSGKEASEERFMSELKAFLEKETALLTFAPTVEQLQLLMKEGMVLKQTVQRILNMHVVDAMEYEEIDVNTQSNKRRKLPDGISKGVELLQNGLKEIGDGLSQWKQNQLEPSQHHEEFLTRFSQLEDVIAQIISLSSNC